MNAYTFFSEPDDKAIRCAFTVLLALVGGVLVAIWTGPLLNHVVRVLLPRPRAGAFRAALVFPFGFALMFGVGMVAGWQLGKAIDRRISERPRLAAYYAAELFFLIVCLAAAFRTIRLILEIGRIDVFSAFLSLLGIGLVFAAYQTFAPIRKNILMTVHDG